MALEPLLKPLFIDEPANAIPGQGSEHGAQQPGQHDRQQGQLALLHIEAPQGHDQFRGDRREQVLEEHRRKDGAVAQPGVGLDRRTD